MNDMEHLNERWIVIEGIESIIRVSCCSRWSIAIGFLSLPDDPGGKKTLQYICDLHNAALDAKQATFPNPLRVRFGEGRILMLTFKDKDGRGVILRDTGETHAVGSYANTPAQKGVMPKAGEIYLHFTNAESAKALRATLDEAIAEMQPNQDDNAPPKGYRLATDEERRLYPYPDNCVVMWSLAIPHGAWSKSHEPDGWTTPAGFNFAVPADYQFIDRSDEADAKRMRFKFSVWPKGNDAARIEIDRAMADQEAFERGGV